jgi:hypothetical protein
MNNGYRSVRRQGGAGFQNQKIKIQTNMQNKILLSLAVIGAVALATYAASPTYLTKSSGAGTAAAPATIIFPAAAQTQIRVVSVAWKSDTNIATLSFSGGAAAYYQTITNMATSSVTNQINSTNGLSGSAVIVLQHAGVCYQSTVSTWNMSTNGGAYGGTNVVLASGGWGVLASAGDGVYVMDTPVTLDASSAVSDKEGVALYVGKLADRPVLIKLAPANVTNQITSATVRYD